MSGENGLILPQALHDKLSFLNTLGFKFGDWIIHLDYSGKTICLYLFCSLILILSTKNSSSFIANMRLSYKTLLIACILFAGSIGSLNKISEFLYFNF